MLPPASKGSVMADQSGNSICYKLTCGAVVPGLHTHCPQCGGRMKSETVVRRLGWVLLLLGLFLVGFVGYIISAIGPSLHAAMGETSGAADGSRFNASAGAASMVLWLLWSIVGFGAVGTLNGLVQALTGRRNRLLTVLLLGTTLAIVVLAVVTVNAIKS